MRKSLSIPLVDIETIVRLAKGRNDKVLAFGELWIYPKNSQTPIMKNRGFVFRLKKFSPDSKDILAVNFPAFGSPKSNTGFQTSFIIEDKNLYRDVVKMFLDDYNQLSGGITSEETRSFTNEDIDPDEIPF